MLAAVRVLWIAWIIACLAGCGSPASPAAPRPAAVADDDSELRAEREQRELERRRAELQEQVLRELRQLRQQRQAASTGAAADGGAAEECELLLFGGVRHDVFLGCLSEEARSDSIFNLLGEHGSDLSPASIRNKFAPYGSNYHDTSACNPAATHPPLVIAADGKSLGLLTLNPELKRRIDAAPVTDWLARMCGV